MQLPALQLPSFQDTSFQDTAFLATIADNRKTLMITGNIRSQIDALWNAFWTGGISNPLEVIEQITYLRFLRGLDAYR